jgi:hypothetical protein
MLSDKEIINLKKEKTNKQYMTEIENKQIADAFKDVAVRFEWIWYGNFPVDEKLMVNSKKEFNKLFALIKS